jgi:hypothetical protein
MHPVELLHIAMFSKQTNTQPHTTQQDLADNAGFKRTREGFPIEFF